MNKPIRVGIDIRDLRIAKTGARTYLEELCAEFSKEDSAFKFVFFDTSIPVYTGANKLLKLVEHLRFLLWKQLVLPFKAWTRRCDILFCTDFFVPLWNPGFKTIPVFHDAFIWEYPAHYNKYWLQEFELLGMRAAKRSPYIVTSSAYAKERIAALSAIPADKIIPVYEAPKKMIDNKHVVTSSGTYKIPGGDFILHVGTFEKRKNLAVLIAAYGQLVKSGHPQLKLVLIGQASSKNYLDDSVNIRQLISEKGLTDNVVMPGYVTNEVLGQFYKKARLYVFPSLNEGFGIPVLESFSYDLPVIIANNSCLPEIAGDAAISFDPYNADELSGKIRWLLEDEKEREDLIKKMRKRLGDFSWGKTAAELKQLFRKAANP